jgi:hypothetical protein
MQFWAVMLALSVAVVEPVDAAGDARQLQESMGCAADLNADGIVSTDDLLALLASFGRNPTGCSDEACQDELLVCHTDMAQMTSDHEDTSAAQALLLSTCTEDLASATAALGDLEATFAAASAECVESTAALQAALEAEHVVAVAALQGSCNETLANSLATAQDECVAATSALQDALETEHDATLSVIQANCAEELENSAGTHGEIVADLTAQLEALGSQREQELAALRNEYEARLAVLNACTDGDLLLTGLTVEDTHEGGGCGPVVVESADTSTATNCDRDYELGDGFASFFETYGDGMFLIQDAHDPNDHAWNSADFARITAPAGYVATLFLFVPGGENAGHSATAEEMPNVIDPRGGWTDTGETYQEANGITRHLWTKHVDGSYALHHAVAQGWGYLYMVQLRCYSAAVPIDCTMVSQPNVSPAQCYDDIQADTHIWQDRSYAWTNGPSDIIGGGWSYFSVPLETGNGAPCPHEGGFNGNIAAAATIAICCANHCNAVNTPVDPTNTLAWTVHPGTFAISNHGGEPCTFFEAQVPAGDYNICCNSCWASGLFLTDAFTPVAGVLPNMEAYYSFDGDNAFDSSGNARDGVWEGTETYVDGFIGRAASFDGLSAIYVSGFENFAWGQAFTISLWFWRGPGCDNNYVGIINGGGYHDTGSWEVRMGRENSCTGLGGGVSTAASLATWDHIWTGADGGVPPAPTDTWNHVVMSYDGVNAAFWLNSGDTGVSTRDNGDIVVDPDGLNIGKAGRPGYSAGQDGSEYFRGYVDEVQIFSAAADQQAVDRMFTGESGGRR